MKIVIVQGAFLPVPPIQGGAVEKIWYRMGKEFAAKGHEVIHISRKVPELAATEHQGQVKYIRIKGFDTPASLLRLKLYDLLYTLSAIRKIPQDADVIVTNTFWSPLLLRGKSGRKVYVDVQRVPKGQMKFYKHVGILRACSPAIFEAIKEEMPANYQHKISYIPNPVPFDVKESGQQKEKVILFVGRLHPEKGVHILIQAFEQHTSRYAKDWKLMIVGPHEAKDGGGGDEYFKQLKSLSSNPNICFVGSVFDEKELSGYFVSASIFCYPAQDGSGDAAPVAPREAMAYGAVVLVSQLPCFNDFIFSGQNGLTYNQSATDQVSELSTALQSLTEKESFLKTLSEAGKLTVNQFAPSVVARQFLNDFKKITGE